MDIKIDLKTLKAAVFGIDLTFLDTGGETEHAVNQVRKAIVNLEAKLTKHLVDYYAMPPDKAVTQVTQAISSGKLFRVQEGSQGHTTTKMYSAMFLGQKGSPNDNQIGEAAKAASRASDGTLWCEDRQLMCAGLIRNGWVFVPEELL